MLSVRTEGQADVVALTRFLSESLVGKVGKLVSGEI
jgi:hypothetical protein